MKNESSTYRRLPDAWVQKIFSTMQANYGVRWLNMWKIHQSLPNGEDIGVANAMNKWAERLAGFEDHPECIAYVLDNPPNEPPSLPEFLELCRRAPRNEPLKLVHSLTQEEVNRNKERLEGLKKALEGKFDLEKHHG